MKKNYIVLNLILLAISPYLQAQVVNGNFETVKPNFLPSNWGMNFSQPIAIDMATGVTTSDNILYTWCIPSMVYASTDAHTGQYAMEISNAYNTTQDIVIPGEATLFSDASQDSPGWNAGTPLEPGAHIERLGFYYKFFAAGNEIAQAKMKILDADGNEIGRTSVDILPTNGSNEYHYIYHYVYFYSDATPAFMDITFNMAKAGYSPTFGSRLIIDNVITNPESLSIIENPEVAFNVYPTLVDTEINVVPATEAEGLVNYQIINTQGRVVMQNSEDAGSNYIYSMNVSDLSSGIYFLQIDSNLGKITKKFIKR